MKTLSLLIIATVISVVSYANKPQHSIKIIDTEYKNILKFKVDKELIGATIILSYSNGDIVTKEVLERKRLVIDFCDVKSGEYTVEIKKGNYKKDISISKNAEDGVQYGK
ncbi:hypothetical protein [Fulvivirga lutea]|uniref:Uncharacterized protein n=1 Tax=Fulvivirga lutea TaxID=2810512 RepID=A0A974WKI1_9BACT|nr:hypothetical protein [Fulvivirga lutea]QSE97835.1 hypothetical protein JR347_01730 [Fulvivirga lutea]